MASRMQKRIVCKYCGYHFDVKNKRCPYCGTYAYPEDDNDSDVMYVTERVRSNRYKKSIEVYCYSCASC